jgi:4a-hydroxytetrahydrobiopterin dehydratase
MDLKNLKCKSCEGGIPSLTALEISELKKQLQPAWNVINNMRITKEFLFINYKHTMSFVNKIAALAEQENHHPVLHVYYNKIEVEIWTHAINGLSENDFILASKIDGLKILD